MRPFRSAAGKIRLKNGSSQGDDMALTVLCMPTSLDSGPPPSFPKKALLKKALFTFWKMALFHFLKNGPFSRGLDSPQPSDVPPAPQAGPNRLFSFLDLCWHSPESGGSR